MKKIEGFVLNGGMSSRMGTAKGVLQIGEHTLTEYAANALRAVCGRVCIVGGELILDGVETVPDVSWKGRNEKASIFGLRSALLHCSTRYAAVLACDMPFVTGEVFERLAARIGLLENGQSDVIVPSDINGWLQPLCAVYERDRARIVIEEYLNTGELKLRGFVSRLRAHAISSAIFADLENADHLFMNINTREDLAEAVRKTA